MCHGFLFAFLCDYAQVLRETDGSGNTIVSYTYGDDLISQDRNSSLSYYHYDGQLSTRQLTDASAQVTDTYTYDAFGLLLARSGSTENNYMYTGEQYDPNVGFYYLRAWYYNPTIGRFHTMDTWPGMQFEPGSLHKYLYCESQPIGQWDPSGKWNLLEVSNTLSVSAVLRNAFYGATASALMNAATQLLFKGNIDFRELGLAAILGAIGNVNAGIIQGTLAAGAWGQFGLANAAYISAVYNTVMGSLYAGFNYVIASKIRGEEVKLGYLLLNMGQGALASLLCGPGAANVPRAFLTAIPGVALEKFIEGAKKFIEGAPVHTQNLSREIIEEIYKASKVPPKSPPIF